jgi:hypothetical protein
MLRITTTEAIGEKVKFRVDGQIAGPFVKLLQNTCESQMENGMKVAIDLKHVSFADREGITLLRSLAGRRVELLNAEPFIANQIGITRL